MHCVEANASSRAEEGKPEGVAAGIPVRNLSAAEFWFISGRPEHGVSRDLDGLRRSGQRITLSSTSHILRHASLSAWSHLGPHLSLRVDLSRATPYHS
jgi:hypothetical protein